MAQAPTDATADIVAMPNPNTVVDEARAGAREDSRIASAVAALLLRQPTLTAVGVQVHAGIVTLDGKVPEDADRERAATLAKQVGGVTDVINRIQLDARLSTRFDSALDQVKGKFVRLVAAIPLLVAAMAIVLLAIRGQRASISSFSPKIPTTTSLGSTTGRSVSCSGVWCPKIDTIGPNGITLKARNAGTAENTGARK